MLDRFNIDPNMPILESSLFSDPRYSCSSCGRSTGLVKARYACISPHVHPNDKGPMFTSILLDQVCGCGYCCACLTEQERRQQGLVTPEEMIGFVSIICADCLCNKDGYSASLREKVLYQYCIFCTTFWQQTIPCCNCKEPLYVECCGHFGLFQSHFEQCRCGKSNYLKDQPFEIKRLY